MKEETNKCQWTEYGKWKRKVLKDEKIASPLTHISLLYGPWAPFFHEESQRTPVREVWTWYPSLGDHQAQRHIQGSGQVLLKINLLTFNRKASPNYLRKEHFSSFINCSFAVELVFAKQTMGHRFKCWSVLWWVSSLSYWNSDWLTMGWSLKVSLEPLGRAGQ